jgi:hypothetical protein
LLGLLPSAAIFNSAIDLLKTHIPGLGEYMLTIQLHAAKLWFADKAYNWKQPREKYRLGMMAMLNNRKLRFALTELITYFCVSF